MSLTPTENQALFDAINPDMTAPRYAQGPLVVIPGTSTTAPVKFQAGTNKTTPAAGEEEFDGAAFYRTVDLTGSRGLVRVDQTFRLAAAGGAITTIGNFFGANSNIALVPSVDYLIEIDCWFLKTTAGTVVWTFTNSAAPTSQNVDYQASPVTGVVAPANAAAATYLEGGIYNDATAALALGASGTLSDAAQHRARFRIALQNGLGTSLKIQATVSAGSITPGIGSRWTARRMPVANIGAFAA